MTPVERLQAAIEKLEAVQGETWDAERWEPHGMWAVNAANPGGGRVVMADRLLESDAHLIVTLHRTIDAQLAILREALFQLEGAPARAGFIGNEFNLFMRLADAILGSDQ